MNEKQHRITVMLVFCSLLAALSIVLGKYLAFNAGEFLRFSFENLPTLFAAIAFGPIQAIAVATVADVVGSLMVGYSINPILTVGVAVVGAVSGSVNILIKRFRIPLALRVAICTFSAHAAGSLIIKSIGLHIMYGTPYIVLIPWRALNYLIVGVLETLVLTVLLGNRAIKKIIKEAMVGMSEKGASSFAHFANSFQAVTVPGLERIGMLCELLGNPERELRIIHVAGTNGKGSTSANIACILEDAGFKVGKYISPNLIKVNERISVCGEDISDAALSEVLEKIRPLSAEVEKKLGLAPTQFEIWTAAAFYYFAEQKCDYVVLEVGLGGELDATNVIERCELSVITRLGLDHTQYLGGTIAEIAAAKAGIIKKNQAVDAVITVKQEDEALKVIEKRAEELGKRLIVAEPTPLGAIGAYECFSLDGIGEIRCGISGYHQIENASLAAIAAHELGIDGSHIVSGIARAKNPARFEVISENPDVIYDGGHNENGITALMSSLERYYPCRAKTVVFACMKDKEIAESLKMLSAGNTEFIFTTVKDNPRADTAEGLLKRAEALGFSGTAYEQIGEAYEAAVSRGRLTVICGSLYLYKDLCEYLGRGI